MIFGSRAALIAALVCILGLAGCSSSKPSSAPAPGTTTPRTTTSRASPNPNAGATSTTIPRTSATSVPTSVPNDINLRRYVTIGSCASASGGWAASGTASNPQTSSISYVITVFFTSSHATVEGFGDTTVTVAAGKEANWSVITQIASPDPHSQCVLRGVGQK